MSAERHTIQLPTLKEPSITVAMIETSPREVAENWINQLEAVLNAQDASQLSSIMHQNSWWRDMLAFSWDIRTLRGIEKISSYTSENQTSSHLHNFKLRSEGKFTPKIITPMVGVTWIESMFDFDTEIGSGSGMIHLLRDLNGIWKGCMIYTALQQLEDFKELLGTRRPHGGHNPSVGDAKTGNWMEQRQRKLEFQDEEPTVLITGAGTFI